MRWGAHMSGMGPDALAASGIVTAKMDKELGTNYTEAVEDYRKHLKENDPAITGAITDQDTRDAVSRTAVLLQGLGHHVEEIPAPVPQRFTEDFKLYYGFLAFMMVRFGHLGVSYNKNAITAEEAMSYSCFWKPEVKGKVGHFDWHLPSPVSYTHLTLPTICSV